MKLYHGTNGAWVGNIKRRGLEPRGLRKTRNNWLRVPHQSNHRCVYLTDSYAPYFAFNATRGRTPACAVVEIDSDRLDEDELFADEDCMEQLGRGKDDVPGNMSERTLWYRDHQFEMSTADGDCWRYSLTALGTCSHRGTISPHAITRIASWPHIPNVWMAFIWDCSITIINQQILGDRYRALTAKLFGDTPAPLTSMGGFDQKAVDQFDVSQIKDLVVEELR